MSLYICKCGRKVNKSSSADNTGNRDTKGCEGCPYLLPWGPTVWNDEKKAFVRDVQGYECRMSPTISYTSTYRGQANDKCTLKILSLDLDFLDEVQAWIYDNAADTLSAGFSRGSMRGTDFSDKGRYSLSISCAQNKKGMTAKARLLDRFFTGGRVRKDMTLEQEKAHIFAAIERGKEQAKENTMKRTNNRCPLQQECERTCQVIGHERDCDYYVNNRYGTEGIPDQDELLAEEEIRQEREREERYLASLSAKSAEPVAYQNEYGTLFAVREHKGAPALMSKAKGADAWTLSGVLAAVQGEAYTAADLQEVLDEYARAHGWQKAAPDAVENPTDAAPASRANAGAAEQSLSAAGPASLEAKDAAAPVFDYSGLDKQTVEDLHLAEREVASGKRMAEIGLRRMADGVAIAHEALCCTDATNCRNGEGRFTSPEQSFGAWCESVGLNRKAAERLLNVSRLFDNSTPREEKVLEELGPSLLYAASKPSAPTELVQAVKDGDITTHKQYQEVLAKLRSEQSAREKAEHRAEEEAATARHAEKVAADALHEKATLEERADLWGREAKQASEQRDAAESRAKEAEKARAEAEKERDGARDALQAAKMRGDKLKAENDALRSRPIEAAVVDDGEVERRAEARAREIAEEQRQEMAEEAAHNAEDAILLLGRQINTSWQMVRPYLAGMDEQHRLDAIQRINDEWARTQREVMQCL